ncbi:O-methyltransferase-domain-containing protein [Aspergillus heterothallicus]
MALITDINSSNKPDPISIAVDLNLFQHIVEHRPINSEVLARLSGGEELLIMRVLRLLSSVQFVQETPGASRTWEPTRISRAMATKEIAASHQMISSLIVPAMQSAPAFFLSNGYACPTDPKNGLVQLAFSTDQTTFERIASTPSLMKDFNLFMGNTMGARNCWVDWYPVQSQILDGAEPDKALIVDFSGAVTRSGQLVLEDLALVVEGLDLGSHAIEAVAYDFFTEQPVKGARAYFFHHILHDWSDDYCLRILENVVSVMVPGYSKLLLHEMIVLEKGAPQFQAQLDMTMMAFNGGMERTKRQWKDSLSKLDCRLETYAWCSREQNHRSHGLVRVDETYKGDLETSIFDYTNTTAEGLVDNTLTSFGAYPEQPIVWRDYVQSNYPLFTEDFLIANEAVFGGLVTQAHVQGLAASWNLMYASIPVTVFVDSCGVMVGYDYFSPGLRARVITEFFNTDVGTVEV